MSHSPHLLNRRSSETLRIPSVHQGLWLVHINHTLEVLKSVLSRWQKAFCCILSTYFFSYKTKCIINWRNKVYFLQIWTSTASKRQMWKTSITTWPDYTVSSPHRRHLQMPQKIKNLRSKKNTGNQALTW